MADNEMSEDTLLTLTADIVAAHVSNNSVAVNDLPNLIQNVHGALSSISGAASAPEAKPEPKVSIRASIKPDYIVCLEDGKKLKMLKRHLMTHYNMTPGSISAEVGTFAPTIRWLRPIMQSSAERLPSPSGSAPSGGARGAESKLRSLDDAPRRT